MKGQFVKILIAIFCAAISILSAGSTTNINLCQSALFLDKALTTETDHISIFDRLFLEVNCEELSTGSYIITTQWIDEQGELRSERAHKFQLEFPQSYSAVFEFKQMPKGTLKKMMSGYDFEKYQYGRWSVLTFINSEKINRKYFLITD